MPIAILLAHGLEGSPEGTKAKALGALGPPFRCPDGRGKILAERVELLRPYLEREEQTLLIGSSYGGLVALHLACTYPDRIAGLILCAPALQHREAPVLTLPALPVSIPCTLIHGTEDTLIPAALSQAYVRENPHIELLLVEDNHRLSGSTQLLVDTAIRFRSASQ
jgi:pimeloyl-ACP methyl ester carboxylesterase